MRSKINPKLSFKNWGAQNKGGHKLREQIRYYCVNTTLIKKVATHTLSNSLSPVKNATVQQLDHKAEGT